MSKPLGQSLRLLARIDSACKIRGRAGLLDLHRSLQRFFCRFLSVAYDLDLIELDNIQPNFPAIRSWRSEESQVFPDHVEEIQGKGSAHMGEVR